MNKTTDLRIEILGVDQLQEYENNAREHGEIDITAIKDSIEAFGFNDPIGIWSEDNVIVEGHGRLAAARALGMTEVPCIRLDHMTDEERRAYALAHNKTAELSKWDFEKLNIELAGIKEIDMTKLGFDPVIELESEVAEDEVPEKVETRCKLGDMWQLGGHRLICGDSTDVNVIDRLMDGQKADMVFTDPPYEMEPEGGGLLKKANHIEQIKKNQVYKFDPSDLVMWSDTNVFFHNKPLIKSYIELAENNDMPYDLAIYKKQNTVPNYKGHLMTDLEYIAIIGNQDPNKGLPKESYSKLYIGQKDSDNALSYSKPIELCAKYISLYSKTSVLDIFGGSGSTLIACEQLKRRCFMCEMDPHYCDVIIARWEAFTGQKAKKIAG